MDFSIDGQLVPDIIYGYIRRNRSATSLNYITVQEYTNYQTREIRRRTWKPITKISTLQEIETAFENCLLRGWRRYLGWDLPIRAHYEASRLLFLLSEWKLTQMPLYKHICPNCKHEETDLFRFDDPPPVCPKCGTEMKRTIGKSSFKL